MSERYSFQAIKQIQDVDGMQKTIMSMFPAIKHEDLYSSTDLFVKLKYGQRLDNLAYQYLGEGQLWWVICLMNGLNTPYDQSLIAGKLLRIPTSINRIIQILESNAT
jgi:hypothetical protein